MHAIKPGSLPWASMKLLWEASGSKFKVDNTSVNFGTLHLTKIQSPHFTIFIFDAEKEGDIVLLVVLHVSPLELKRSYGSRFARMFGNGCKIA